MADGTRVPLLDVNLLVALAVPEHVHHRSAHAWLARTPRWATTPPSQSGFVRVVSNPHVTGGAVTPADAIAIVRVFSQLPGHVFWPDATRFDLLPHALAQACVSHRLVTDMHLLAIASANDGSLATFDAGACRLAPDRAILVPMLDPGA
jgi:toxin-antitoxin system PIN domain toxin